MQNFESAFFTKPFKSSFIIQNVVLWELFTNNFINFQLKFQMFPLKFFKIDERFIKSMPLEQVISKTS